MFCVLTCQCLSESAILDILHYPILSQNKVPISVTLNSHLKLNYLEFLCQLIVECCDLTIHICRLLSRLYSCYSTRSCVYFGFNPEARMANVIELFL